MSLKSDVYPLCLSSLRGISVQGNGGGGGRGEGDEARKGDDIRAY